MSMPGIQDCWEREINQNWNQAELHYLINFSYILFSCAPSYWNSLNFANFTLAEILFKTIWNLAVCQSKVFSNNYFIQQMFSKQTILYFTFSLCGFGFTQLWKCIKTETSILFGKSKGTCFPHFCDFSLGLRKSRKSNGKSCIVLWWKNVDIKKYSRSFSVPLNHWCVRKKSLRIEIHNLE